MHIEFKCGIDADQDAGRVPPYEEVSAKMSKIRKRITGSIAIVALASALAAPGLALAKWENFPGSDALAASGSAIVAATTDDTQLANDLAFMREEEKLAHDVYTALGAKWKTKVFSNIASSEQRHTDAMLALMKTYGVADPAAGKGAGAFADANLQSLYDELMAKGSASLSAALQVGKTIEEVDIADLDDRIARTSASDVLAAYKNLRAGSVNHLAAFNKQISGKTGPSAGKGRGAAKGIGAAIGSGSGSGSGSGRGTGPRDGSGPGNGAGSCQ